MPKPSIQPTPDNQGASATINVVLTVRDSDDRRWIVDDTIQPMSVEEISAIIDHAAELVLARREGRSTDEQFKALTEALANSNVIEPDEECKPGEALRG